MEMNNNAGSTIDFIVLCQRVRKFPAASTPSISADWMSERQLERTIRQRAVVQSAVVFKPSGVGRLLVGYDELNMAALQWQNWSPSFRVCRPQAADVAASAYQSGRSSLTTLVEWR